MHVNIFIINKVNYNIKTKRFLTYFCQLKNKYAKNIFSTVIVINVGLNICLSRFLSKILRENKIAMKSFSKICRSVPTLNCRSGHSCIKLTHTA